MEIREGDERESGRDISKKGEETNGWERGVDKGLRDNEGKHSEGERGRVLGGRMVRREGTGRRLLGRG